MRGVFIFFVLLVAMAPAVAANDFNGTVSGFCAGGGLVNSLLLQFQHSKDNVDWQLAWEGTLAAQRVFLEQALQWDLAYRPLGVNAVYNHNLPHYTSKDAFRLIHKNNYSAQTTTWWLHTPNTHWGWFSRMPHTDGPLAAGGFFQGAWEGPSWTLGGSLLKILAEQAETFIVLESEYRKGPWRFLAAMGQRQIPPAKWQGRIWELHYRAGAFQSSLLWQNLDAGFASPFATSNKYTPDRRGWQLQASFPLGPVQASFNRRLHYNLAKTRAYRQFSLKLAPETKKTELEWRLEPTSAFILRYNGQEAKIQVDLINQSLRFDWRQHRFSFAAPQRIARLEIRFGSGLKWRLVGKRDFLRQRTNYSLLLQYTRGRVALALEVGQYDRGNIHAGFDTPGQISISWEWGF